MTQKGKSNPMLFEIRNAQYHVDGTTILKKISLRIEAGQHLLLAGPSGCGKTTLMHMMAGLLRTSSGDIIFDSQNYTSLSDRDLDKLRNQNFGVVFQKIHLIKYLTVLQNIKLSQTKPNLSHIQDVINTLGLSDKKNQKSQNLSVGEAQRVAIARAMSNKPRVIFIDEPTSALDNVNATKVMDLILDQADKLGATIIAATHDDRIKDRFQNVLELSK